jgi:acetyl esterase
MLEELDASPPVDFDALAPAVERAAAEIRLRDIAGQPEVVNRIEETSFVSDGSSIRARIYRPEFAVGSVLFLHGGGWVVGSLDTHDNSCRMLANRIPANVVSIEYRKAPEHQFPAGLNDCKAGLDWLLRQGPELGLTIDRLVVCGESAGGNLAAVLARHARDRGIPLAGQALIYPVISTSMSSTSYTLFGSGFYLSAAAMTWFIRHYAPAAEMEHPDIVPINATDLAGLAPAFIATMSHDPLRDEGRAYAAALVSAGTDVTYREMQGTVHGVWVMAGVTAASTELITTAAQWIRGRLWQVE